MKILHPHINDYYGQYVHNLTHEMKIAQKCLVGEES